MLLDRDCTDAAAPGDLLRSLQPALLILDPDERSVDGLHDFDAELSY